MSTEKQKQKIGEDKTKKCPRKKRKFADPSYREAAAFCVLRASVGAGCWGGRVRANSGQWGGLVCAPLGEDAKKNARKNNKKNNAELGGEVAWARFRMGN